METIWFLFVIVWVVGAIVKQASQAKKPGSGGKRPPEKAAARPNVYVPKAPVQQEMASSAAVPTVTWPVQAEKSPVPAEKADALTSVEGAFRGSMAAPETEGEAAPDFDSDASILELLAEKVEKLEKAAKEMDRAKEEKQPEGKSRLPRMAPRVRAEEAEAEQPDVAAPAIKLDFSPDNLLQAVVLQEVLTRPMARRRAGR